MNLQKLKQAVQDSPSSIFTKEDIMKLLNGLQSEGSLTQELADEIHRSIWLQMERLDNGDVIEFDSAEFDLDGNTITLSNIDLDLYKIKEIIEEVLNENVTEESSEESSN
jgi:aminoglycoside phosphotransferase